MGYRLSCQVPVKQHLKIEVPEEVFGVRKWECEVLSNPNVATFIKELNLRLPEGEEVNFPRRRLRAAGVPPRPCALQRFCHRRGISCGLGAISFF